MESRVNIINYLGVTAVVADNGKC